MTLLHFEKLNFNLELRFRKINPTTVKQIAKVFKKENFFPNLAISSGKIKKFCDNIKNNEFGTKLQNFVLLIFHC